jgi:hypothetical protein
MLVSEVETRYIKVMVHNSKLSEPCPVISRDLKTHLTPIL